MVRNHDETLNLYLGYGERAYGDEYGLKYDWQSVDSRTDFDSLPDCHRVDSLACIVSKRHHDTPRDPSLKDFVLVVEKNRLDLR